MLKIEVLAKILKHYSNWFYLAFRLSNPICETQRFSNSLEGSQYLVTETCYGMLPISAQISSALVHDCLTVLWQLQQLLLWKGNSWKVFNLSLAVF